jgi:phosphatidylserine decarboxylase
MATIAPTPPTLCQTPIASIQPGGGFCFDLERAWGRCRRAWLRRFRPGYVRRMTERRQGQCPGCPHDIIDPRDLKLYRNVCGYWFREEDDAFRWRDRLRLARAGLAEVVCFSALFLAACLLFGLLGVWWHPFAFVPLGVAMVLWLFVLSFFRDPERTIPDDPQALLSPADGTVTHVGEVVEPDFPGGRAFAVSIFLSVFNVHVNRLPRSGRVAALRYFPGAFLDARHGECAIRNEQFWIDLEDAQTGCLVRTKQIAGAIARRIVCWLKANESVRAGGRLGMIKFGSRTEVYVPVEAVGEVLVKVGDKVRGGGQVLLRFRAADEPGASAPGSPGFTPASGRSGTARSS